VVRPELDAGGQSRGEDDGAPALEAADLGNRAALDVPAEPEEQRGLVDLQGCDAVVQLVRGEEEREVLEAADGFRPPLDVPEAHRRRVTQDRGMDEVLADRGATEPPDEVFRARHGRLRYCKV